VKINIRDRLLFSYLGCLALVGSVAFRSITANIHSSFLGWVVGLIGLFTLLFLTEWMISQRWPLYRAIYFVLQILNVLFLLLYIPPFDYFAILFVPLVVQAFWLLARRTAFILTGLFIILSTLCLVDSFGWWEGLGYSLTYTAVFIFLIVVCLMTLRAEEAQRQSQALLSELRTTHQKLQAYAQQVEELAAAQERSRLARELHDSVTQTIFSMTLTAQSARILLERDPTRIAGQLDHLQALAQSALAEMRSLIQQHPRTVAAQGLLEALRRHMAERAEQDNLQVDLRITGDLRLPPSTQDALFRVIQEGLNNVVKHAKTSRASVTLCLEQDPVWIAIDDQGAGFDPDQIPCPPALHNGEGAHLGLAGMAQRVAALGGTLLINSKPGAGTHIRVEGIHAEEKEHE
jgi:signal transduction histidine kinase